MAFPGEKSTMDWGDVMNRVVPILSCKTIDFPEDMSSAPCFSKLPCISLTVVVPLMPNVANGDLRMKLSGLCSTILPVTHLKVPSTILRRRPESDPSAASYTYESRLIRLFSPWES